nr:excisionase family DNA-binding protein [Paenibacillus flagellatus]
MPPTLSVLDAAAYLNVGKATIDRRISSGVLRSYKDGRLRRIRREDILEYQARLLRESERREGAP